MLKIIIPNTAIRIQKKTVDTSQGYEQVSWQDVIDEDIFCEWKNRHGTEVYKAVAINAVEPASLRLWYIPDIDAACRVVRLEEGFDIVEGEKVYKAVFEIINVDDIMNRHQQLEIEVKRYKEG